MLFNLSELNFLKYQAILYFSNFNLIHFILIVIFYQYLYQMTIFFNIYLKSVLFNLSKLNFLKYLAILYFSNFNFINIIILIVIFSKIISLIIEHLHFFNPIKSPYHIIRLLQHANLYYRKLNLWLCKHLKILDQFKLLNQKIL